MLVEIDLTPELLTEVAQFLSDNGSTLEVRNFHTPELARLEFTRRRTESARLAAQLVALIALRATKPIDLEIQDAGARLAATGRKRLRHSSPA